MMEEESSTFHSMARMQPSPHTCMHVHTFVHAYITHSHKIKSIQIGNVPFLDEMYVISELKFDSSLQT